MQGCDHLYSSCRPTAQVSPCAHVHACMLPIPNRSKTSCSLCCFRTFTKRSFPVLNSLQEIMKPKWVKTHVDYTHDMVTLSTKTHSDSFYVRHTAVLCQCLFLTVCVYARVLSSFILPTSPSHCSIMDRRLQWLGHVGRMIEGWEDVKTLLFGDKCQE